MDRITLEQISELSDKEKRQLKACTNEFLGRQYATRQRRKKVMKARMEIERNDYEDSDGQAGM